MKRLFSIIMLLSLLTISCTDPELTSLKELSFSDFINQSYIVLLKTYPELVTELGLDDELGLSGTELNSYDEKNLKKREELEAGILTLLKRYNYDQLSPDDKISYSVYEAYLNDLVEGHQFRYHNYLLHYMLTSVNVATEQFFTEIIPVRSVEEAEKYINRLHAVLKKMEEVDQQLELQEQKGIVLPSPLLSATLRGIRNTIRRKGSNTTFYQSFEKRIEELNLDEGQKKDLLARAEKACDESVIPGYKILEERLISQQSSAPVKTGVGELPDGRDYYSFTLRHHTNSAMTAQEIHERGLEELERIHREMRNYFDQLEYNSDEKISILYGQLKRDDRTLSGSAVVEAHRDLIDEAIEWMEPYFADFPERKVSVKPDSFGGFYIPPSFDGSRAGTFYASTGSVSYFTLPTLTFHETYPGHHYQISLAGGMDLPLFRRQAMFTGYLEGWALYSEFLMAETGFYKDDIPGRLGHLQAQAFRAARLVVDTGLHLYGWDIKKAIEFFADNTGFDRGFAGNQIYRYLVWPGQAASYYTGYMEFRDIQEKEQKRLGSDFNFKAHHSSLIDNGPMPLTVLKEEIFHYE